MILTSKNMRNELLLNYHKFKKIREIMTTNLKSEISDLTMIRLGGTPEFLPPPQLGGLVRTCFKPRETENYSRVCARLFVWIFASGLIIISVS